MSASGAGILRGREIGAPFTASVDVVVVGSGAGGAVVAREMARAGRSVLVLEEGGHYPSEEYRQLQPTQMLRRMARESGLSALFGLGDTPLISAMAGKCVGGSSVLTGGVCFRIPDEVLHGWSRDLGLTHLAPEALDPYFAEIEEAVHVEEVPREMRSRGTELFAIGADKLGIEMKNLRRNTRGCRGAARCTFGCPHGAKMSVDVSMLPDAVLHGATILADALVERVDITGGQARGVRGRFLDQETGEPRVPFEIRARVVVVACGSLHTPLLLRASGLDSRHIGRHLTLHPAFRVCALFDEEVAGWDGAMQSAYSDHFQGEGITLNGVYSAASILAAGFPGVGKEHRRLARQLPQLAVFGGQIHDDPGGRVRRWLSREPLLTYRMSDRDRGRLFRGMEILGRMAFAAGAREVILPIFGGGTLKSEAELDRFVERPPRANRVECLSFHPLGSARMSMEPTAGVVRPSGETWAADNLFVCDGSILPTSIAVNSQIAIMTVSLLVARSILDQWNRLAARAA